MFVCMSFLPKLNAIDNKMMTETVMTKTVYIFYHPSSVSIPKCLCLMGKIRSWIKYQTKSMGAGQTHLRTEVGPTSCTYGTPEKLPGTFGMLDRRQMGE